MREHENPDKWNHFEMPKKNEGIKDALRVRVGEIKAWRCWEYHATTELLHSLVYPQYIWVPQTPLQVDYTISKWGYEQVKAESIDMTNTTGIHAYKTYEGTREWSRIETMTKTFPLVIGTVKLWGTIVEHEGGYRAEYASISSIDKALIWHENSESLVLKLQKIYQVGYASTGL